MHTKMGDVIYTVLDHLWSINSIGAHFTSRNADFILSDLNETVLFGIRNIS